jgi:hypothetical protein
VAALVVAGGWVPRRYRTTTGARQAVQIAARRRLDLSGALRRDLIPSCDGWQPPPTLP